MGIVSVIFFAFAELTVPVFSTKKEPCSRAYI